MTTSRVALVTGAASGLGQALAQRLSRSAAQLVLCDINGSGLQETSQQCSPASVVCSPLDITDVAAVQQLFSSLAAAGTPVDLVFHAAGILSTGTLDQVSAEDCRRLMEVNYFGTVNVLLAAAAHMKYGSRVLCVASVAGLKGLPEFAAYCGSKFAVVGFCEAVHGDFKRKGIALSVVCPPAVDTPMVRGLKNRPALYEIFPFANKSLVIDRVMDAVEQRDEFLILIDAQTRLLYRINGLLPTTTRRVVERLVDRWERRTRSSSGQRSPS
jgi:NAD(P)-dependent dehydrogenase (short-subunit alcohol dehydrogenase family)